MRVVYIPPRKQRAPRPPWRTWFVRPGTIVEKDGAYWVLEEKPYRTMHDKVWVKEWRPAQPSDVEKLERPGKIMEFDYKAVRDARVRRQVEEAAQRRPPRSPGGVTPNEDDTCR